MIRLSLPKLRFYFSFYEFFCSNVNTINKSMISHYISVIFFCVSITCRSSRPYVFCKKDVHRNFTKFTGKHLCQSLFFNKVAACRVSFLIKLQPATLLKKKFWHRCFPVNFAKILRTPFLTDHLRWLLLYLVYTHLSLIPASFIFSIKLRESLSNLLVVVSKQLIVL